MLVFSTYIFFSLQATGLLELIKSFTESNCNSSYISFIIQVIRYMYHTNVRRWVQVTTITVMFLRIKSYLKLYKSVTYKGLKICASYYCLEPLE